MIDERIVLIFTVFGHISGDPMQNYDLFRTLLELAPQIKLLAAPLTLSD